ncbi:MAG: alpha-L-fucosidase, partial [Limisphaerales bacterium]
DPDVPTKNGYRSNTWDFPEQTNRDVFAIYFKRKVVPQITELLTQYHPAVLWFDTPEEISPAESQQLLTLIHKLQPDCIVNSRIGHGLGDYGVQEQKIPGGDTKPWETCMTLNSHWAYFMGDNKWKTPAVVVSNLVTIASRGGNYLLDVGPTGQGVIQPEAVNILKQVGDWLKVNGESVYGTTGSPLKEQLSWGRVTKKGDTLYLHVFNWPKDGKLFLPMEKTNSIGAYFLEDREISVPVAPAKDGSGLELTVPPQPLDPIDTVVVLQL